MRMHFNLWGDLGCTKHPRRPHRASFRQRSQESQRPADRDRSSCMEKGTIEWRWAFEWQLCRKFFWCFDVKDLHDPRTAPAPTEPPTDLAGASMVIAPLPPIGPTDAPEAKAPAPATAAPAPAPPAKPKAPEPTPEPLKPFPGGMSVEDITGDVPALTGDFPAAPTFLPTKPAEPTAPTAPTVPTGTAAPLLQLTTKAGAAPGRWSMYHDVSRCITYMRIV